MLPSTLVSDVGGPSGLAMHGAVPEKKKESVQKSTLTQRPPVGAQSSDAETAIVPFQA